jgi:hypothetical protein
MLAKARIINYDRNCSFIVLATVIMIVNYDCHLFIVLATALMIIKILLKLLFFLKKIVKDKHSSLYFWIVSDKEKKGFMTPHLLYLMATTEEIWFAYVGQF